MTSHNVKHGKYTFNIQENIVWYQDKIMYITLKMGGLYPDCVNIVINNNNNKFTASMPHVMYDENCDVSQKLEKGEGSVIMINALIEFIKTNYPTVKEIDFDDMSSIECASASELSAATNKKHGTNVKPLPLYYLSIAYNGKTWYEKHFNAVQKKNHTAYKERVNSLLNDEKIKPANFAEFIKITALPQNLFDEIGNYYSNAKTYGEFFNLIPKEDRCRVLRPWIDRFMKHYLQRVFSNSGWTIPLYSQINGGKKTRKHKKSMPYYIPFGFQRNSQNFMNDVGEII